MYIFFSAVKGNHLKPCANLVNHFLSEFSLGNTRIGSETLLSTNFAGTTTMLKCFDALPCGGLGVCQKLVLCSSPVLAF